MTIDALTGVGWDELAAAFTAAFADYAVPLAMTAGALEAMQRRRGYDASLSFGAREPGGRLVGFVLTCRDGDRIYNSGTGVEPAHRRGGVARALLDAVVATAPRVPYVLEVLEDNSKAIAFYASAGFAETRRLQCWSYTTARSVAMPMLDSLPGADDDLEPAWQNTRASIRRATEPSIVLGDDRGAIVVFPATGDVPLLVVPRAHRRRGRGRELLAAAATLAGRPLRLLNLDVCATGVAGFLASAGATPTVRQLEMVRGRHGVAPAPR